MSITVNNKKLSISSSVKTILNSYRQSKPSHTEAGGVLIGQINESDILINRISIPSPFDTTTRYSFIRDKKAHQMIMDYEFANSEGKNIYIGEWHTHPAKIATPSTTDVKMIKDQYKHNQIQTDFLILIILGLKTDYLGVFKKKSLKELFCGILTEI